MERTSRALSGVFGWRTAAYGFLGGSYTLTGGMILKTETTLSVVTMMRWD
jgi:hypothetical protein